MRVIGTAGHVDHGKSSLVRRLTGIEPDRLVEEKARELTIDLGFAWMPLASGEMVGIVDVPGHRDFIENMLAGVGGIDAVVLVIAADEGVMPQTREHLAILDLLGIQNGVVALTKTDLVDDPEWLTLVKQDIRETLQSTQLGEAPILPVSARTGDGIDAFKASLESLLTDLPTTPDIGQPRLSIDRVFTISGFGTVVTGTLLGGTLSVGDEIELQPGELRGRVRGLQSYNQTVQTAYPGSRVAANLTGIEKSSIRRGQTLAYPRNVQSTPLVDVYFRHLPDSSRPLTHNAEVKVFSGAAETVARVRLLNDENLPPGAEGWLQLRLSHPLPLSRGDHYILRYPSPPETIGGGIVVEPQPRRRWKRFRQEVIDHLEMLLDGSPGQRVAQAAEEPIKLPNLQRATGYNADELQSAVDEALREGWLVELEDGLFLAMTRYRAMTQRILQIVADFHTKYPLRLGIPREELRSRLGIKNNMLNLLLRTLPELIREADIVRQADHAIRFTPEQERTIDQLAAQMQANPFTPPSFSEAAALISEEVLYALIDLGEIVQVQPDVIFSRTAYEEMVAGVLAHIDEQGEIDAKALRDRFQTSRKYAIGLLEHLDDIKVTRRVGDVRVKR